MNWDAIRHGFEDELYKIAEMSLAGLSSETLLSYPQPQAMPSAAYEKAQAILQKMRPAGAEMEKESVSTEWVRRHAEMGAAKRMIKHRAHNAKEHSTPIPKARKFQTSIDRNWEKARTLKRSDFAHHRRTVVHAVQRARSMSDNELRDFTRKRVGRGTAAALVGTALAAGGGLGYLAGRKHKKPEPIEKTSKIRPDLMEPGPDAMLSKSKSEPGATAQAKSFGAHVLGGAGAAKFLHDWVDTGRQAYGKAHVTSPQAKFLAMSGGAALGLGEYGRKRYMKHLRAKKLEGGATT